MSKVILVTGATGKQGGSVIDALLKSPKASDYTILAVTRDANGSSAQKLVGKSNSIKVIGGNLDDVPGIFAAANKAVEQSIWGVFSVQISMGKGVTLESEVKQGNDLIDESIKNGVKHFVYSSVERGGDDRSWDNPTPVDHFKSKHAIEHHLKESAVKSDMGWTILRPVGFMDNLEPGMPSKVFLTAMRDTLKGKSQQWIAVADIGGFAAEAFDEPEAWNHKAMGLAGDELTFDEQSKAFERATGSPAGTAFSFMGSALMYMVAEVGRMITWWADEGYKADVGLCRETKPDLMDFETWLKTKSGFVAR